MHQVNGDQTVQRRVSVRMETAIQVLDTASVMQVGNSLYTRVGFVQVQTQEMASDPSFAFVRPLTGLPRHRENREFESLFFQTGKTQGIC